MNNFAESFRMAIQSIGNNKVRSFLTMLGLIIGIGSVVAVMALGDGSAASISGELDGLGANVVSIQMERGATITSADEFTISDLEMIEEKFGDDVIGVSPGMSGYGTIITDADLDDTSLSVSGAIESVVEIENLTMVSGRSIIERDIDDMNNVIIIDDTLSESIFGSVDAALGQQISIMNNDRTSSYNIIGIYEGEEESTGYATQTGYTPYSTVDKDFNLRGEFTSFDVAFSSDAEDIEVKTEEVISLIENKKGNAGEEKYTSFSMEAMLEMATEILGTVTLLISSIAGISLLVGGIGIMNIMLVSVTERTREIGIRKALGAKYSSILSQFLIEAVVVSALGGIIGTILGFTIAKIGGNIMGIEALVSVSSVLIATLFSAGVGILFGVYPASKAAKLDPIEALRYE